MSTAEATLFDLFDLQDQALAYDAPEPAPAEAPTAVEDAPAIEEVEATGAVEPPQPATEDSEATEQYQVRRGSVGIVWQVFDTYTGAVRATAGTEEDAKKKARRFNRITFESATDATA